MQKKVNPANENTVRSEKVNNLPANLKDVLSFLVSEKFLDFNKIPKRGNLEENIKQKIEDSFKEKYQTINGEFSELRKSGKDLGVLNFKLIMLPLKIKVFLSTYEKKDAENVLRRMQEIEKEIGLIKK